MRFLLIHGGYHGAWCWTKVIPELEALGHDVVAIDLPGAGKRVNEKATISSWRAAMAEVIEDGDILVGHSLGGFVISLAADEVPEKVGRLIFLSAAVPIEGSAISDTTPVNDYWQRITGLDFDQYAKVVDMLTQGSAIAITNPDAANKLFYHDCGIEDQAWAFERLTPLPMEIMTTPLSLPRFWQAPIPKDYILCTDDRTHPIEWDNEWMQRLGLNVNFGIISSHSPFISRPVETAKLFDACARGALQ